jgi:predicted nucleic acid-binding protein
LRQRGKIIPYTDILIGSAAMLANALLLHADRHFDLIAEDSELKVRSLISVVKR